MRGIRALTLYHERLSGEQSQVNNLQLRACPDNAEAEAVETGSTVFAVQEMSCNRPPPQDSTQSATEPQMSSHEDLQFSYCVVNDVF